VRVSILVLNDDAAARGADAHPQEPGPRRDKRTLTRCATLADLDDRLEEAEQLLDAAFALRIDIGELLEATLLGAHTSSVEEPLDEGNPDVPNADQNLNLDDFPHIRRLEARQSEEHSAAEFKQALEDLGPARPIHHP
jgi:hypothetical protein